MIRFYREDLPGYMERWVLRHPWGEIRLHHILRSDSARAPHDHPFAFVSTILWGSYSEELYITDGFDLHFADAWTPPRWIPRFVPAQQLHRLVLDAPVWTLVFTGHRFRSWGFFTDDGWVPWTEYVERSRK